MKDEKKKHDHKFTKLLKVCLFGLLMLMPLLALTPNILYYAFNEHATNEQETTVNIEYEYQTNEVNNYATDIIEGNIYKFEINTYINTTIDDYYILRIINGNNAIIEITLSEYIDNYNIGNKDIRMVVNGNGNCYLEIYGSNEQDEYTIEFVIYERDFPLIIYAELLEFSGEFLHGYDEEFKITECPEEYIPIKSVEVETTDTNIQSSLENATNQLWNNSIFSWVQNTTIATGLYAFTSVMGIPNNTMLSNLIVYWLIITAIYVVIDIVIELFVYLTHILNG